MRKRKEKISVEKEATTPLQELLSNTKGPTPHLN